MSGRTLIFITIESLSIWETRSQEVHGQIILLELSIGCIAVVLEPFARSNLLHHFESRVFHKLIQRVDVSSRTVEVLPSLTSEQVIADHCAE